MPRTTNDQWPPPRHKWPANCTPTADGWVRWYKGRTRRVAPKSCPLAEIEDRWIAKKAAIDKAEKGEAPADADPVRTYRMVASEFLSVQEARIDAPRHAIRRRTYQNYAKEVNAFGAFVYEGVKVGDRDIRDLGPPVFSAYARTYGSWKSSGFDSVVTRLSALFSWAEGMEYIDRFRPGPEFRRPAKANIRSERIDLAKSFTPTEAAKLYLAANHTVRCWVALGCCAAFNNSDIAHVSRTVTDLDAGVIDFRRRKTGKVRRVIPLPADVVVLLKQYGRPEPANPEAADLFFLTERTGLPYSRTASRDGAENPSCSISRLFAKLMEAAGVEHKKGRNFSGLRTTFYNLAPRSGYDTERKVIMGRAQGTVDLDAYLEDVGLDRLKHVVDHVWGQVRMEIDRLKSECPDGSAPRGTEAAAPSAPPSAPAAAGGR